ncbi:hypothetical protein [Tautonia rosea]|uniref:hypothetical protein n=1 Tax=Tautonia rosea TaxID=2728037 RepID=UPI0014755584|nr:hypothetical protein [Tautonia rosea]
MRTLASQQTELIRRIGERCPLAIVALTVRTGLRVRRLVDHPDVTRGMTLALRIGREYCLRDDRPSRARLARALGYLKTLLDAIEPGAPMETVPYQAENAAVARLSDVVQAHEDMNLERMRGMAEFAARSASFAAELAAREGQAAASDEDRVARGLGRDLDAASELGPEITALDPGPGGPLGPLWDRQDGPPAWEPPGKRRGDLTRISDSEISRLVEYADKKAHLGDTLDGATLPDRSGVAESLEAIGRDIERAAAPLPAEFGRALREGMPAGEAVAALSAQLDALHRPVVEALRGLLSRLHEAGSLGSYEENARAADEVYRIAKSCGADLIYDGEAVALGCVKRADYKDGAFRVRTLSGKPRTLLTSKTFPSLQLSV